MTTHQHDEHDPATVDGAEVRPAHGLGANFETRAFPILGLSTKSRIWGDKFPGAVEPTDPSFVANMRRKVLVDGGHRCAFCGFYSELNEVHNLNDVHRDIRPENLRPVDPLCHGWQHLGELGEGNAVVAYLPGLSGQDVNHLQRTIMVAMESGDLSVRDDARRLLNWLASHREYTREAWGTSEPGVFASALVRSEALDREDRAVVLQGLAVIFAPGLYGRQALAWTKEAYRHLPAGGWYRVYHDVMNAPA